MSLLFKITPYKSILLFKEISPIPPYKANFEYFHFPLNKGRSSNYNDSLSKVDKIKDFGFLRRIVIISKVRRRSHFCAQN